jgi:hypothetical protein
MPRLKRPTKIPLATLTQEQETRLNQIERDAFRYFAGQFDDLQKAIGVLRLGHHVGWKPLVLIHSKKTIAKYEEILGIELRELFPEEGPSALRSNGYSIAKKLSNFWKAVSGETSIDGRKEFSA